MQWGGGGAGMAAAVGNAAAAVATGLAECVVVHRGLAQGQFKRFGRAALMPTVAGANAFETPYGMMTMGQKAALRVQRLMQDHGIGQEALRAISMASYAHAQRNPRAIMQGRPLTEEAYDASRWIVEPFHLFDCCMENDGAAAVVVVPAEHAPDRPQPPVYLLGVGAGQDYRATAAAYNEPQFSTGGFGGVAQDLYRMAGVTPADVGVVQVYDHFTGGVLFSLIEHGFFAPGEANEFLQLPRLLAPDGALPLNTSGGNLAECYMHGMGLLIEGVRQVRRTSTAQARRSDVAMVIAGSMAPPVSSLILGSPASLA
jgi:acetyl-CoA acetyltransferase